MKRGFTLIELMVVIGIIGILSAIILAGFKGSTESARMAKCKVHLRQLAQASTAKAMTPLDDGTPGKHVLAGSFLKNERGNTKAKDRICAWIGYSLSGAGNGVRPVPFYQVSSKDGKGAYEVMTNGTLWTWVKSNRELYCCPTYVKVRREQHRREPLFTYVMNSYFWYDYTRGQGGAYHAQLCQEDAGVGYGEVSFADKRIMFAELPLANDKVDPVITDPEESGDDYQCDCTLQASGKARNVTFEDRWKGKPESIGFPHKIGKRGFCGNVVFSDCHTETIMHPEKSGGLTREQLTVLLCSGTDYVYSDGKYDVAYAADEDDVDEIGDDKD